MDMATQIKGTLTITRYSMCKVLVSKRIVLVFAIMALFCSVAFYGSTEVEQKEREEFINFASALVLFFILPVITMIYGSSLIRDEIVDRSITQIATSPLCKASIYIGYYLGLIITVSVIMVLVFTSGFLIYFGEFGFDGTGDIYGSFIKLMIIGTVVYSSLFMMVSLIFRTPIYFGLFFVFIWELFIGNFPGRIKMVAINHYLRSLGSNMFTVGELSSYNGSTVGDTTITLAAFVTISMILGILIFTYKEYP